MKVLFLAPKYYRYGDPLSGLSHQYINNFLPLQKICTVIYYSLERLEEVPVDAVQREILGICKKEEPDVFMVWIDQRFDPEFFKSITRSKIVTIGSFGDDDSGFFGAWDKFSGAFDWETTIYPPSLPWHKKNGANVIGWHGAFNQDFYKPLENFKRDIDVSFVGNEGPQRRAFINKLENAGIKVNCFGSGWPSGSLLPEKIVEIFNRSKINLNMSGQPLHSWLYPKSIARIFVKKVYGPEGGSRVFLDMFNFKNNFITFLNMRRPLCRGRHFEVTLTRSFQLVNREAYFYNQFEEGREIVHYFDLKDLVKKIRYYLVHDEEREAIAAAAYGKLISTYTGPMVLQRVFDIIFDGDPKRKANLVKII